MDRVTTGSFALRITAVELLAALAEHISVADDEIRVPTVLYWAALAEGVPDEWDISEALAAYGTIAIPSKFLAKTALPGSRESFARITPAALRLEGELA